MNTSIVENVKNIVENVQPDGVSTFELAADAGPYKAGELLVNMLEAIKKDKLLALDGCFKEAFVKALEVICGDANVVSSGPIVRERWAPQDALPPFAGCYHTYPIAHAIGDLCSRLDFSRDQISRAYAAMHSLLFDTSICKLLGRWPSEDRGHTVEDGIPVFRAIFIAVCDLYSKMRSFDGADGSLSAGTLPILVVPTSA